MRAPTRMRPRQRSLLPSGGPPARGGAGASTSGRGWEQQAAGALRGLGGGAQYKSLALQAGGQRQCLLITPDMRSWWWWS